MPVGLSLFLEYTLLQGQFLLWGFLLSLLLRRGLLRGLGFLLSWLLCFLSQLSYQLLFGASIRQASFAEGCQGIAGTQGRGFEDEFGSLIDIKDILGNPFFIFL
jgi:hypothetical protein